MGSLLFFCAALIGIGIDVLMDVMVHHAADDGVILFSACMLAFFALREMKHTFARAVGLE